MKARASRPMPSEHGGVKDGLVFVGTGQTRTASVTLKAAACRLGLCLTRNFMEQSWNSFHATNRPLLGHILASEIEFKTTGDLFTVVGYHLTESAMKGRLVAALSLGHDAPRGPCLSGICQDSFLRHPVSISLDAKPHGQPNALQFNDRNAS